MLWLKPAILPRCFLLFIFELLLFCSPMTAWDFFVIPFYSRVMFLIVSLHSFSSAVLGITSVIYHSSGVEIHLYLLLDTFSSLFPFIHLSIYPFIDMLWVSLVLCFSLSYKKGVVSCKGWMSSADWGVYFWCICRVGYAPVTV